MKKMLSSTLATMATAALLVGSAWFSQARESRASEVLHRKCVPSTNNICATCATTGKAYQCAGATLPTGYGYGSCVVNDAAACFVYDTPPAFDCGNFTSDCKTPSNQIMGDTNCSQSKPPLCSATDPVVKDPG